MSELVVTWIEVARYVDSLLNEENGRRLVMAKTLKYLLFKSFMKSLKPEDRALMKSIEMELLKRSGNKKRNRRNTGAVAPKA